MRFKTSQTTPAYLDRRLQRRMLSFVGLISVIMFTLSAMNLRSRDSNSQSTAGVSPDTLTFEVRREERNLKDGEFIIPVDENDGPRGQSPRSAPTGQDRELFTTRAKERLRSDATDDTLFRRRTPTSPNADRLYPDRSRNSVGSSSFDDDEVVPARRKSDVDRTPPKGSPLASDDWLTEPQVPDASAPRHRTNREVDEFPTLVNDRPIPIDGLDTERRIPASPVRKRNSAIEPVAETREPIIPNRNDRNSRPAPIRKSSLSDFDETQDFAASSNRPTSNPRDRRPDDARQDSFNDENLEPPIDLRRRGDPSRLPAYDTESGYGDVAPVRIDRRFLDVVKDNTIGIRRDEAEVYYWLLDHARRVPSSALERAAEKEVQYINVMTEPDRFRGEPITIEGDLWRLYELEAGKNQYGVTKIYEGWVFTGDSSNHPYRIVCTSLPGGIEPGENLRKPVRITGYFFKREGYRSNGGVHVAPTLLARRISINPMPNGIPLTAGVLPYMIGAIMAIGLALLVTIIGFAISDGRSAREGMERVRRQPQVSFAGMVVPESVSVEESLRQLAERERDTAVNGAYGPLFSQKDSREHAVHDYATSHQILADSDRRLHRQQTNTLQSWSARQKAAQSEIDALRATQSRLNSEPGTADDKSGGDDFDSVQRILVRPNPSEPSPANATGSKGHSAHSSPNAPRHVAPTSEAVATTVSHAAPETSPVTPPAKPSNPSMNGSKLSEWEEEIAKMGSPSSEAKEPRPTMSRPSESPASVPKDFERRIREQELLQQIQSDREEIEQEVQEDADEERIAFDRADRDITSFSLASPKGSADESVPADEDGASDESEKDAGFLWGRFRKRRNR